MENHKDVQNYIIDMCVQDAFNRKCMISLKKLTFNEMYNLRPASEIDPYSSLEDIGDTSETDDTPVDDETDKKENTKQEEQYS